MKKWTLFVFCCAMTSFLSAQVQSKETNTNVSTQAPASQATTKPLSEADELDREFLLKTYTEKADRQYIEGDYLEAYKNYKRIQALAPSPANEKKLKECRKLMHKKTTAPMG